MPFSVGGAAGGAMSGAQLGSMVAPGIGTAIGAGLGGLAGGLFGGKSKKAPPMEIARQRAAFSGPLGRSTQTGFTYNALPGQLQAAGTSGTQLNQLLSQGLAIDPNRQARYQQAYYASRAPDMIRQQKQQQNQLNNARAASGQSGSMAAILGGSLLADNQARQLAQLQSQSVLGGEALANQALQQDAMRANVYNQQLQQLFGNRLNAMTGTQNAYNAQAQLDLAFVNQRNAARQGQFGTNLGLNRQHQTDLISGGMALANALGGGGLSGSGSSGGGFSFGALFGGGGGGGYNTTAPLDTAAAQSRLNAIAGGF